MPVFLKLIRQTRLLRVISVAMFNRKSNETTLSMWIAASCTVFFLDLINLNLSMLLQISAAAD